MRFGSFRLERYGPFEQLDLTFDPTPGRINLVVARNGFGKSVIRRAFHEFLFGIEARTPMSFRFGTERMRLLADIHRHDATQSLVRRKGNGNTWADADGTDIPSDEARRLLGGADETVYRELFGLDTALLRSGGRELIRSQGRLGQVLFAAGGGMARVRELLAELERKRDDLGKATARHRSRPLWNALSAWEQGNADLRRAALRPDGWTSLEQKARDAAATLETLLQEQTEEAGERDRLRTIAACRPWLDRLRAAQHILADAADAPELDDGFEKRWRDALESRVKSASSAAAAGTAQQDARNARAALTFNPAWIDAAPDINALADLRGRALGAETDLPNVQRALDADRTKEAALRRELGWDDGVSLPPPQLAKDAQKRLQKQAELVFQAETARNRLADAERLHHDTRAALAKLPNPTDVTPLADLTAHLRAGGDPASRLDATRAKLRAAEAALRTALAAIPDGPFDEASLHTTWAPSETRLDAAGKALSDSEHAHDRAVRAHEETVAAMGAESGRLAALEAAAMLPAPDALATARAHRDALWACLCAPAPIPPDQAAAVALDRAIRDADAVADALIAHSQDLATANGMRAALRTLDTKRTQQQATIARTEAALAEATDNLLFIARQAGGNATDMSSLRAFLRARQAAVEARHARDAAVAERTAVEQDLATLGAALAQALGTPPQDLAMLNTLLAEADRRISADHQLSGHRQTLIEQEAGQRAAHDAAAAGAIRAEQALAQWTEQWRPVAAALARPADEPIAATAEALVRIEDLRATAHSAQEAFRRIHDMQAAIALLASRVVRLAELAPDLASLPPADAAEAFRRRLQNEQQQAIRCADADKRVKDATNTLAKATTAEQEAARTLDGLRAALRAADDEQAEQQLQRARSAAAARRDSAEAQRHLLEQGGGLSIEALAARAAETTAEADAARIAAIDANQQTRVPRIDAARTASAEAAAELDQAGSLLNAAEAAQRREAAQAMLARTAEEALILHATHALLQEALERQAAGADQPLLARIAAVFRTITGGAQAGVRIEDAKDGQTMVALEADGQTRKSLDQLSEGTSDQLFLALRIAALEDYARIATPLPFIADDILQTFDDSRTETTLQALRELSHQVQVIILTHHAHVGALADRLQEGIARVMRLDD